MNTPSLHIHLHAITTQDESGADEAFKDFIKAISLGADAEEVKDGKTPSAFILEALHVFKKAAPYLPPKQQLQNDLLRGSLDLICLSGANPWDGAWDIAAHDPQVALDFLKMRTRVPKHKITRNALADNDLHFFLQDHARYMALISQSHEAMLDHLHPGWMEQQNQAGETPLHLIATRAQSAGWNMGTLNLLDACVKIGGELAQPDHTGRSAASMLIESEYEDTLYNPGFKSIVNEDTLMRGRRLFEDARTLISKRALDQETACVPRATRPSSRL